MALRLGDDCLVLSQRLSEWTGHAPELEEDVALANIALDLLGQARNLLTLAATGGGGGRDEDDLAYLRDDREFRNLLLVEQPNGDFACTITRQLLFAAWQLPLYRCLATSRSELLAGIAAKGVKEASYHLEHVSLWTLRLGDGTEESHSRMQAAVDLLWPWTGELFESDPVWESMAEMGVVPPLGSLVRPWRELLDPVLAEATLGRPEALGRQTGGRRGLHSEHLGHLLAEMQHLHRTHPHADW